MTTPAQTYATLRALLEANVPTNPDINGPAIALRWRGEETEPLPANPSPFIYTLFDAQRASPIEHGRGRGFNRYRNPGSADIYIFMPRPCLLQAAMEVAAAVANLYRSFHDSGVTCTSATVYPGGPGESLRPPGMNSEVGNYVYSGVGIEFYYDLIG